LQFQLYKYQFVFDIIENSIGCLGFQEFLVI
jgi:hypothetical protein